MNRRRAAVLLALAAALLGGRVAVDPPARGADPAPAPEQAASAVLLGGFRVFVANALWVRLIDRYDERAFEEVLPLAETLLAIEPRAESAWFVMAWTLAVDMPDLLPPAERWPWVRQGALLIREGARKNPGSWFLTFHDGLLVEHHIAAHADRARRFAADPALDPERIGAEEYAARRFRAAVAMEGHAVRADWALAANAIRRGRFAEAEATLEHIRVAHPDANRDQLRILEENLAAARARGQ